VRSAGRSSSRRRRPRRGSTTTAPTSSSRPSSTSPATSPATNTALDRLRAESSEHGWHELFADRYPHAGGEDHTALYLENAEGFEIEIVVGD